MITDGQGGAGQVPAGWWGMHQAEQMLGNWAPPPALGWSQSEPLFTNGRVVEVDEIQGVGEIEEGMQQLNAQ
jgi:hypothetical protein